MINDSGADFNIKSNCDKLQRIFSGEVNFIYGSYNPGDYPPEDYPEIAFIGKSNVGKSSLVNTLTSRRMLARVSHTPGRTKQINFFNVRSLFNLVDLPGYGYAKVSATEHRKWENLILNYFNKRKAIRLVCVLIDSRRGIAENDLMVLNLLNKIGLNFWIIFTKSDKIKKSEADQIQDNIKQLLLEKNTKIIFTSSKNTKISEMFKSEIYKFISNGFIEL
jgi:GTP-binding protein